MNQSHPLLILGTLAVLLTGCLTQQQLIERRIGRRADFFASLPAESQQRLREGRLAAGDSADAAWIVYGSPDRLYQKVTATSTNEVWSYVAQDMLYGHDELRPVYHPVRDSRGRTFWHADYIWIPQSRVELYEYRRLEFQDGRILSVETESPSSKALDPEPRTLP